MSLEERVKNLEDWRDAIVSATLGQPVEPRKEKDYFKTEGLTWSQMPATPTNQGAWEKCEMLDHPNMKAIISAFENSGAKTLFSKDPDALYWLLKERETGKVTGLGRRKK